ncbi:MAG: Gx transporter family protein [Ruminococcus sp.]|nr:Gx transporter family protein [Ruminococcus sp.]
MPERKPDIKRLTELSLLTAVSLIMFVIEMQLPPIVPVPGVKLGLANIITVYAVYNYKPQEAALVFTVRVLIGSLFSGNVTALIFSFSGGVLCLLGMILISRISDVSMIVPASVIGAALHNIGQIIAAVFVMNTTAVISYLPYLLFAGSIAGAFTGTCALLVIKRIRPPKD